MLDQAVAEGDAPALAALLDRGTYIRDCVSTFPSVTPVASAAIATGCGPGEHHIPSMNWFHRGEERYVEYGSSLPATRAFGIVRSLYDTVYNMNLAHLTRAHRTVFEHLDDAGLRTACTTYLIYRGRTRHDPSGASVYRRIAEAAQFRHPVYGARELFYADLFDSRDTGCTLRARDARPARPAHGLRGRVSGRARPLRLPAVLAAGQRHALAQGRPGRPGALDRGGRPRARADHARGGRPGGVPRGARGDRDVGPLADRRSSRGSTSADVLADMRVLSPSDPAPTEAELAACPSARSAMVYALDDGARATSWSGARPTRCSRPTAWSSWSRARRARAGALGARRAALRARRAT